MTSLIPTYVHMCIDVCTYVYMRTYVYGVYYPRVCISVSAHTIIITAINFCLSVYIHTI